MVSCNRVSGVPHVVTSCLLPFLGYTSILSGCGKAVLRSTAFRQPLKIGLLNYFITYFLIFDSPNRKLTVYEALYLKAKHRTPAADSGTLRRVRVVVQRCTCERRGS